MDNDVLVVGAGRTGLTLACAVAAAGIKVRVVDGAPAPATTSRALALQPRGVEVLNRLGALAGLPERAQRIDRLVVFVDGKRLGALRLDQALARWHGPGVLIVSQAEIERALRDRLAALGGSVQWNRPVVGLGDVVRLPGDDGAALLIRPDGHLAWRGTDPQALRRWLADLLGSRTAVLP